MSKRLLMVNVLVGALAVGAVGYIAWELARPVRPSPAARPRPAPRGAPVGATPTAPEPAPGSWTVIASRNLFSPARSEAPGLGVPGAASTQPKPFLYGVVLRDGAPIAYLEDPVTKRVSAYRVGDAVAGATLRSIGRDHVVLVRPEGTVDVRLRDPNKPQVAAPAVSPAPGAVPGVPPSFPGLPPGQVSVPGQPPVFPAPGQGIDPRRPLRRSIPPSLIRRLPQGQVGGQPGQESSR